VSLPLLRTLCTAPVKAEGRMTRTWHSTHDEELFAVAKQGLVDRNDGLRVSISQPLHVEHGSFGVSSIQVIDPPPTNWAL
jgi:hypothetical protein